MISKPWLHLAYKSVPNTHSQTVHIHGFVYSVKSKIIFDKWQQYFYQPVRLLTQMP